MTKKPESVSKTLWSKQSEKDKEIFVKVYARFSDELKDSPKVTDDVIAHNLAWVAVWMRGEMK
jgi:hypothetical protein